MRNKADEIRMISAALRRVRRPIVLSLSPGPAPLEKAIELRRYAQMWRISDDVWDVWYSDKNFPQGAGNQFARAAKWAAFSGPGHWPDADMLPLGRLEPAAVVLDRKFEPGLGGLDSQGNFGGSRVTHNVVQGFFQNKD